MSIDEAMVMNSDDVARELVTDPNEALVDPAERKLCGCCKRSYSLPEFKELRLVGYFGDLRGRAEMRNCSCTNTIAILHTPRGVLLNPTLEG